MYNISNGTLCYIKHMVARKGQILSWKSNKKTNEKFNNYINKERNKNVLIMLVGTNNVGGYENVCEIEK